MKSAIIFTGFARAFNILGNVLYDKLYETFPNADTYVCTWDTVNFDSTEKTNFELFYSLPNFSGAKILVWEKTKSLIPTTKKQNRIDDVFDINRFAIWQGIRASNNIRNQWYLVNKAKEFIDERYDIVVRTRFDLKYHNFECEIKEEINLPFNFFSVHYAENMDIEAGFCDHLAYGTPQKMIEYFSMCEHIDEMYEKENANIAHAEGLLKYYLTKYKKINVGLNNKIQYQIVKSQSDIDDTPMRKYEL